MPDLTNNEVIEVIIPEDKINDNKYLYKKLLETSADILYKISTKSGVEFKVLLKKYLPDILDNEKYSKFLSKYDLDTSNINTPPSQIINTESKDTVKKAAPKLKVKQMTVKKAAPKLKVKQMTVKKAAPKLKVKHSNKAKKGDRVNVKSGNKIKKAATIKLKLDNKIKTTSGE